MVWLYWNAQFYSDEINDVTTSRDISTHDILGNDCIPIPLKMQLVMAMF